MGIGIFTIHVMDELTFSIKKTERDGYTEMVMIEFAADEVEELTVVFCIQNEDIQQCAETFHQAARALLDTYLPNKLVPMSEPEPGKQRQRDGGAASSEP